MEDLRSATRREFQLDAISSVLILAMAVILGLLLWLFAASGVQLPPTFPLADYVPRVLLGSFVLLVVLYLWDQRRQLRAQVDHVWAGAEAARAELATTCTWLAFSHDAASKLGAQGVEAGMNEVLSGAADVFAADAAAVLGEENEYAFIAPGVPAGEADRVLTQVAVTAAGRADPFYVQCAGAEHGQAIAVPLRVQDSLRYVLCIWRRGEDFSPEQLDALGLMARTVELAIEREESLAETRHQFEGTLRVLEYLVADKRPDYSRHALAVADMCAAIARRLQLQPQRCKDLRLAGLVHDVGMVVLPPQVAGAGRSLTAEETLLVREHPRVGSDIAKAANFSQIVADAVASHHERIDGSGYPLGLSGNEISVEARILAVCEVYDSMTHRTYHGVASEPEDAITELRIEAGVLYDGRAVSALLELVKTDGEMAPPAHSSIEETVDCDAYPELGTYALGRT